MPLIAKSKDAITVIFSDPWVSLSSGPSLLLETLSPGSQNLCLPTHSNPDLFSSYLPGPYFSASIPSPPLLGLSAITPGPPPSYFTLSFHSLSMEPNSSDPSLQTSGLLV